MISYLTIFVNITRIIVCIAYVYNFTALTWYLFILFLALALFTCCKIMLSMYVILNNAYFQSLNASNSIVHESNIAYKLIDINTLSTVNCYKEEKNIQPYTLNIFLPLNLIGFDLFWRKYYLRQIPNMSTVSLVCGINTDVYKGVQI